MIRYHLLESRPNGCQANLHGVARVDKALGATHGQERVLFNSEIPQTIKISTVPGEVRMGITQA